jgi:glycosyltransferase involved in cell wall biosynthesis
VTADAPTLTVVIPAFNEVANLAPVINELFETVRRQPAVDSFEVVIVDDGSRDGTAEAADALAASHAAVRVVHHPINRGYGAALRTGFSTCRGRYVTAITADGEIDPAQVLGLFAVMGDADLMIGTRERTVSAYRNVLTFGLHVLMRLILGFVPDAMTVFIVRGDLLRRMELQSNTGLANLEVRMYCRLWGCRIRTGPTQVRRRLSGESKVTNVPTMVKTFWEMAKLRRALRRRAASHRRAAA